jgi:hypothetical protein
LLSDEDWSSIITSQALHLHESNVNPHLNEYLKNEKLKPECGRSESRLNADKTEALIHIDVK